MSAPISLRESRTLGRRLQRKIAHRKRKLALIEELRRNLQESGDADFREHLVDLRKFVEQKVWWPSDISRFGGNLYNVYGNVKFRIAEHLGHSDRGKVWLQGRIEEDAELNNYVTLLASTGLSTDQESRLLELLEDKLKEIKPTPNRKIENLKLIILELERELKAVDENIDRLEKEEEQRQSMAAKKREKQEETRARLDSYEKKSRAGAARIRKKLPAPRECPYCGKSMNEKPVADHIWPIAEGGQSKKANMVKICYDCNAEKGSLTLREFCKKSGYDFTEVSERLEKLGKTV
jgi:5-methylcytosine-specific restriction endonuclease McrA